MNDVAICIENLSKKFIIGGASSGSLREAISSIFGSNSNHHTEEEFWALQNISFEIKRGEAIGIIGKNGAGKSTLLKILSRITEPTTGRITINGRISSLLEVGTGFHPELSGRENVFLNGTILGMKREEIKAKFDEIVEFSGVAKFLDTPVKHYSSGMKVRLAFAVAAHLEPEILIIDEVLAVGDAEFQKKCLGKMEDVTGQGRTILFVSHNMTAVSSICRKCIWLKNGKIYEEGEAVPVINKYLFMDGKNTDHKDLNSRNDYEGSGKLRLSKVLINNSTAFKVSNTEKVVLTVEISNEDLLKGYFEIAGKITDNQNNYVHYFSSKLKNKVFKLKKPVEVVYLEFQKLPLQEGIYYLGFEIKYNSEIVYKLDRAVELQVLDNDFYGSGVQWRSGLILLEQEWY